MNFKWSEFLKGRLKNFKVRPSGTSTANDLSSMTNRHDEFYVNGRERTSFFYHFFNVIGPLQKFSESNPI